jgi:hypothetical protein
LNNSEPSPVTNEGSLNHFYFFSIFFDYIDFYHLLSLEDLTSEKYNFLLSRSCDSIEHRTESRIEIIPRTNNKSKYIGTHEQNIIIKYFLYYRLFDFIK